MRTLVGGTGGWDWLVGGAGWWVGLGVQIEGFC